MGNLANEIGKVIGNIFSPLWDFITNLLNWLNPFSDSFILKRLWEFLVNIISYINPADEEFFGKKIIELLGNLLQWLFVPDENYFYDNIEELKQGIAEKIPYQDYIVLFETIKNIESGEELSINLPEYKISDSLIIQQHKFIDFSNITKYKETWYSWVRGFTFIFMIIYNINQMTKFLRGINVADGSTIVGTDKPI